MIKSRYSIDRLIGRIHLVVLVLCVGCVFCAQSQNLITTKISKNETHFPYVFGENKNSISIPIFDRDTSLAKYILPITRQTYFIYKLNINNLLPSDDDIRLQTQNINKEYLICVIPNFSTNKAELIFDSNNNLDFTDDSVLLVDANKPFYRNLDFFEVNPLANNDSTNLINNKHRDNGVEHTHFVLSIPVEFEIFLGRGKADIYVSSLLNYKLELAVEDTLFKLDIFVNAWCVNFKILDKNLDGKIASQRIRMNEPFYFNNKLRVIEKFDLMNETVNFRTLNFDEKPFGYREGYYLNMDKLLEFTNFDSIASCQSVFKESKYYLLHFWGQWCHPCVQEIDEVKKLSNALSADKLVTMIHYPTIFKQIDRVKLDQLIIEKNVPCPQVVQQLDGFENVFDKATSILGLTYCTSYPTYILIDKNGKIVYRGNNKNKEVYHVLAGLDVLDSSD